MTSSPAGQTTAERLAAAWNDSEWVVIGSGESRRIVMAEDHERWEHLARLVEQIAAERAATELEGSLTAKASLCYCGWRRFTLPPHPRPCVVADRDAR